MIPTGLVIVWLSFNARMVRVKASRLTRKHRRRVGPLRAPLHFPVAGTYYMDTRFEVGSIDSAADRYPVYALKPTFLLLSPRPWGEMVAQS